MHYDFDGAQQKLAECESVLDNDYFLTAIKAEFLESARLFMFENYCRIHQVRWQGWWGLCVWSGGARSGAWCTCKCTILYETC